MNAKIKAAIKNIAVRCKELNVPYERNDTAENIKIEIGHYLGRVDIEVEKESGLYSCWINNIPASFHCDHKSHYAHEMWIGSQYNIKKHEVKSALAKTLFESLVNLPHAGHYEKD